MKEVKPTIEDLKDVTILENIEQFFDERIAAYDEVDQAKWFELNFTPLIEKNGREVIAAIGQDGYDRYKRLVVLHRWIMFSMLSDDDCTEMFRSNFRYVFELPENIDMWKKIKAKLQAIHFVEDRDAFKKRLLRALMENKEIITESSLIIGGKQERGEIGAWLRDYNATVGGGSVDNLKREQYLIKSRNTKTISESDRKKLAFLTGLVERLKISSAEPEGLEDPIMILNNGKLVTLKEGTFEPIDPKVIQIMKKMKEKGLINEVPESILGGQKTVGESSKQEKERTVEAVVVKKEIVSKEPVVEPAVEESEEVEVKKQTRDKSLVEKYAEFVTGETMKAIVDRSEGVKSQIDDDMKALRNEFYRSVNKGEKIDALAVLMVVFEKRKTREVFSKDERFVQFWAKYLENENDKSEIPTASVEEFKNDPANGKDLARFFKYILEDRLKIKKEEAVMWGMVLSNLARQASDLEYQDMVYGDMESQKFKWNF